MTNDEAQIADGGIATEESQRDLKIRGRGLPHIKVRVHGLGRLPIVGHEKMDIRRDGIHGLHLGGPGLRGKRLQ